MTDIEILLMRYIDQIAKLVRENEVLRKQLKWQPIATAPIQPFDKEKWYMGASPRLLLDCGGYTGVVIGVYGYTKAGKGRWKGPFGVVVPIGWKPLPESQT